MDDTICAISTAINGAISIVRLSGADSISIVNSIFTEKITEESHKIYYGHIKDEDEVIDEVLVMVMKSPRTYTTEDIVEINCHGGITTTNKVLELLLKKGARLAEPGEFTKRAYLNGRINLLEAESVNDLITAKTDAARKLAINNVDGKLSKKISNLREKIAKILANIEVNIDYPEYTDELDVTNELMHDYLTDIKKDLDSLVNGAKNGRLIKEGVNVAIIGKPNVGKSSILNSLLDEDKAIVTNIPGTTRDIVEGTITIDGVAINLIDTAGIHNTEDTVEKIGVDRAKQYIEQADFILFVVDGSEEWSDEDEQILPLIAQKKGIILLNKADLKAKVSELFLKDKLSWDTIAFSNETKQGLQQLEQYITDKFERGDLQFNDQICLTSIRHKNAVMQAVNALHRVEQSIKDGMPEDFFTIDLMEAYQQLGLINGDTATEDLVNKIFEEFCMGK